MGHRACTAARWAAMIVVTVSCHSRAALPVQPPDEPARPVSGGGPSFGRLLPGSFTQEEVEATRRVMEAIVAAARDPSRDRPDSDAIPAGDALTQRYVRAAARASESLAEDVRAGAFLAALGLALDDSELLRSNPVTGRFCREVESDAERTARLRVLGQPTMLGRRDLAQHFVVSAFLSSRLNAAAADAAGLAKELSDAARGNGFSFADLAADRAGIALATRLPADPALLGRLASSFRVADFMPPISGLPEGLSAVEFREQYQGPHAARFEALSGEIRERIRGLRGYRGEP